VSRTAINIKMQTAEPKVYSGVPIENEVANNKKLRMQERIRKVKETSLHSANTTQPLLRKQAITTIKSMYQIPSQ
jgi:hypothetical protein